MTTEVLAVAAQAGVPLYFGQGRIWYLKTAVTAVTIECRKTGQGAQNVRRFINVAAGFKFKADAGDGWDILVLTSAGAQNIEIIVGDDDVEVSNAVTVNGSVTTQESPFTTPVTPADVPVGAGGNSVIAANLARRAIIIGSLAANADPINLRIATSAAARGIELQAGMSVRIPTTASLTVFNGGAVPQSYWIFEET